MRRACTRWMLAALVMTCSAAGLHAGVLEPLSKDDAEWVEQPVETQPALPEAPALEPFTLEREARHRYFVDRRSVTLGEDGVIRFVLAIKPSEGRVQSSHVGLRCATAQWKTYAVVTADGAWRRLPNASWENIEAKGRDSVRGDLYRHYFCSGRGPAGTPDILIRRLRVPFRPPVR